MHYQKKCPNQNSNSYSLFNPQARIHVWSILSTVYFNHHSSPPYHKKFFGSPQFFCMGRYKPCPNHNKAVPTITVLIYTAQINLFNLYQFGFHHTLKHSQSNIKQLKIWNSMQYFKRHHQRSKFVKRKIVVVLFGSLYTFILKVFFWFIIKFSGYLFKTK